jgi:hypothetical protein
MNTAAATKPANRRMKTIQRSVQPNRLKKARKSNDQARYALRAERAGAASASGSLTAEGSELRKLLQTAWLQWLGAEKLHQLTYLSYCQLAKQFTYGFCRNASLADKNWLPLPTDSKVAVVLSVMNEEDRLPQVLKQLDRLTPCEVIAVVNGSTDDSLPIVHNYPQVIVAHFDEALGYDVGRAIGARLTDADIVLFLDGDIPIPAEQFIPFIAAVASGTDVALNQISHQLGRFSHRDGVTMMKEFVNRSLGRADLLANSMTAIPHALSRRAIEQIGLENLCIPPKAQVIAISQGLNISAPFFVDVIRNNKLRGRNQGSRNQVSLMIIGDHLEALDGVMEQSSERLNYPDKLRNRSIISEELV